MSGALSYDSGLRHCLIDDPLEHEMRSVSRGYQNEHKAISILIDSDRFGEGFNKITLQKNCIFGNIITKNNLKVLTN